MNLLQQFNEPPFAPSPLLPEWAQWLVMFAGAAVAWFALRGWWRSRKGGRA